MEMVWAASVVVVVDVVVVVEELVLVDAASPETTNEKFCELAKL